MEADCEDQVLSRSNGILDMNSLFESLSDKFTSETSKLSKNFQSVVDEHDLFKQEVRAELDDLRKLVLNQNATKAHENVQMNDVKAPSSPPVVQPSFTSTSTNLSSATVSNPISSPDLQQQMMMMMTESFTKLSTALTDSKQDVKAEWPKFGGDSRNFRSWYLGIMTQLSLPPWQALYDPFRQDVVITTQNSSLNAKLYSKIILALEGAAYKNFVSRKHLRANGILLLEELAQTYKPRNVLEIIAAKTIEFWGQMWRNPTESIDAYYDRFHELLEDLADAEEPIAPRAAIRQFIFTLGPEFESIRNKFCINNLPPEWRTQSWPTLPTLCRNYYNSVKAHISNRRPTNSGQDQNFDHEAHQHQVRTWFMNPVKYCQEIAACQNRYPGRCIYHLARSHPTEKCGVKKECDEKRAGRKNNTGTNNSSITGQLRHLTEESFVDAESEAVVNSDIDSTNDTNEDALLYFARLSKHYFCIVKQSNMVDVSRHSMAYPVIADSRANYHMFRDKEFVTTLTPAKGHVILGDGVTTITIHGVGTVTCKIGSHTLEIPNVRFVPGLSESIYSLHLHIKTPSHGLESSFEKGLYLQFPHFQTKAMIGEDDIYLDMIPVNTTKQTMTSTSSCSSSTSSEFCRNVTQLSSDIQLETAKIDNILKELRHYYGLVKTKRQHGFDVPAGFRRKSLQQQQTRLHTTPNVQTLQPTSSYDPLSDEHQLASDNSSLQSPNTEEHILNNNESISSNSPTNQSFVPSHIPIVRSVDKPSSSLPKNISMTEDYLRSCVGFRRIDTLRQHLKNLYQNTIKLDNMPPDAVHDPGFYATLRKKDRNTTPIPRPNQFGDIIHLDIVFGPEVSVGNVHYGLICVDRLSRMTYIYPLQNLTTDIRKQLELFFSHIGMIPHRIITDFDLKLIGGKAREYFNSLLMHVNAAPPYRQDKNGLSERHWQTLVSMSRNWLASAELPASVWFYAVKRAAEVCNYFPLKQDSGTFSTPFELVHCTKPDLRTLFKPFCLAAVRRERLGDEVLPKFSSQSIPMITIGRCPHSDGLQFFNPENGTTISSIDYKFQPNITICTRFGYKYQAGTFIYRLDETTTIYEPTFPIDSKVYSFTTAFGHCYWYTILHQTKCLYCEVP
jgi:hypothetical protein